MRKIISWLTGAVLGGSVGAAFVTWFLPNAGENLKARLSAGFGEALNEARKASADRRAELEEALERIQRRAEEREQVPPARP